MPELVKQVDVYMLLRVQLTRFNQDNRTAFSKTSYTAKYGLTEHLAKTLLPNALLLHPAPVNRHVTLASDLVHGPQSRIFTQMQNGVLLHLALHTAVLNARHFGEE